MRVGDGSNTDLTAALVTVNPAKTVITINPAAALVSGARYTVTLPVNTVEDEQGNEQGAEQSATFTVDTAAPTVTFVPAHGTKTGNVDTDVLVQFDEAVRQADGNALTVAAATAALTLVRVGDGSNTDLTAAALVTVNPAKTVITINPAAALVSGARYTVTLPANTVEDEQGNEQGAEQSATFTVDTAAPTVTFVPAHGTKTATWTRTYWCSSTRRCARPTAIPDCGRGHGRADAGARGRWQQHRPDGGGAGDGQPGQDGHHHQPGGRAGERRPLHGDAAGEHGGGRAGQRAGREPVGDLHGGHGRAHGDVRPGAWDQDRQRGHGRTGAVRRGGAPGRRQP